MSVKGHLVGKKAFMNNMAIVMSAGSLQKISCSTFIPLRSLMSHVSAFGLNNQACVL